MEGFSGLTDQEVLESREKYGSNIIAGKKENPVVRAISDLAKEPMVLLLMAAAAIYFISGDTGEGIFMAVSIVLVSGISLYQDARSRNALAALKSLTQPEATVIRNGITSTIKMEELVVGDIMLVEEGRTVPADGIIAKANDFSLNESILTGESFTISKNESTEDNQVYQGTSVTGGLAICRVSAVGSGTRLGKIGISLETIEEEKTPLQIQIHNFVRKMALLGILIFIIVWAINFSRSHDWLDSFLKALTLAMSILPEEIPVAFTTFMALGAWRLLKQGVIVKQTTTVEALGSASVICTDKTGTLTQNKMSLVSLYVFAGNKICGPAEMDGAREKELIRLGMWASEPIPYDPMEQSLHEIYGRQAAEDERPGFKMIHEYPLDGRPPMMTHIFENGKGQRIIATKGAPEAILAVSMLSDEDKITIADSFRALAGKGYRVLGVAESDYSGNDFPEAQQSFRFQFKGLLAFYDPPKPNIEQVLNSFHEAGINVKIVTGDNALTTSTLARQIGFRDGSKVMDGENLIHTDPAALESAVDHTNIFTRMFPEAKMAIINALKAKGHVVAMTGDGVNDGPALKASHIGIAMGYKGSEIAKKAASLVLTDDDLGKMVTAIAMGRRIYTNLKKAIRYIISIHIPIILTVFIPLAAGWIYPNIFTPVHVIFLELIMGPTCSIIYENEPMEKNIMKQAPRPFTTTFFNWKELNTSIIQGLAITAGTMFTYLYSVQQGATEDITRTMVFLALITANIFLTLVNRSFYYSIFTTAKYRNNLVLLIIGSTILLTLLMLVIPAVTSFFGFAPLTGLQALASCLAGSISVLWFEIVKWIIRIKNPE
ncbi:cation-translocating P-type ATPase [Flavihumibacter stibioxidans]|uniref:Haloacid dehalogenase n=1 Tax=Flavihumibacter stibioxidans TaxID=1834163 RepID=A0ABR7M4D5_9BACT|nr:cation-translocating P-type ATPase [Flavihumibacter stibioxidans]MBC6489719.1 haloacid dehalogenase [Flavihumibacter stibioxidans]